MLLSFHYDMQHDHFQIKCFDLLTRTLGVEGLCKNIIFARMAFSASFRLI